MEGLLALAGVVMIDLVLAGDNALVIGALAAKLPDAMRKRAIMLGIGAAIVARLLFSLFASYLLMIPMISVIGGALLLWIAWKLWQDTHDNQALDASTVTAPTSFGSAVKAILIADISMSLDNVLGVAGTASGHPYALIIGLALSMVLMGGAANFIAAQMQKRPWLIYVGIATITVVAIKMLIGWAL